MRKLNTVISSRINRSTVLSQIHHHPMISRAQVATMTGLDRSAITHILKELLDRNLVEEVEKGKAGARGGRCPIFLRVNYSINTLLAIDVGTREVVAVLTDLAGQELVRKAHPIERGCDLLQSILALIDDLKSDHADEYGRCAVVAISSPGVVDFTRRTIVSNIYHGWNNLAIGEALQNEIGFPVLVENDANAAAMGQLRHLDQSHGVRSLIYLFMREASQGARIPIGAGGALILNGRLWRGVHNCSGEIAQVVHNMMERIVDTNSEAVQAMQGKLLTNLLQDAAEGKRESRKLLSKIAREVGSFLSDLAVFIDPDAIMVEVSPPDNQEWFITQIQKEFEQQYSPVSNCKTSYVRTPLNGKAVIEGLIALCMEKIFVPDNSEASLLFQENSARTLARMR